MTMPRHRNNFTRVHGIVAAGLLAAFTTLVLFFCLMNWRAIGHDLPLVLRATLATVTGPFDGTIARPGDRAAWVAARWCLPACAALLVFAVLCQVVSLPFPRSTFAFRIGMWTIGLFVWLSGAIFSLLNAIN